MWREVCIVLVTILLPHIDGSCFHTYGRIDRTANGKEVAVCEYNGIDFPHGSSFTNAACSECYCYEGLLTCCGYGMNVPSSDPPPGCKHVADGCQVLTVKQYDENLDCYTGEPLMYTSSGQQQDISKGRGDSGRDESDSTSTGSSTGDTNSNFAQYMMSDPYLTNSNIDSIMQNTYGGTTGSETNMLGDLFLMSAVVDFPFF